MKIISYNVNGIRAAISKGFIEWLQQANPDVICLQEIKANEDQIPTEDITKAGFPFQYYFSAQKKGYSGVAILCKKKLSQMGFFFALLKGGGGWRIFQRGEKQKKQVKRKRNKRESGENKDTGILFTLKENFEITENKMKGINFRQTRTIFVMIYIKKKLKV